MATEARTRPTADATRTPARRDGYLPIGDYGAIGNGASACLVGLDGAIDWLCAPHLDSEPIFDRLLDAHSGGCFELCPEGDFEAERAYLARTNVLETTFSNAQGRVKVLDAVGIGKGRLGPSPELIRRVEVLSGSVRMRWRLRPGGTGVEMHREGELVLARRGSLQILLRGWDAGEPAVEGGVAEASVELGEGASALLSLQCAEERTLTVVSREGAERRLSETEEVWRAIVSGNDYDGPWQDAVERSLLAVMLLSDSRSGAIAAAPTSSLPEVLRGSRNYDYRFAWVRDLSFTLDALLSIGIEEPTGRALDWILKATRHTHPRVDPVYTLSGEVLRSQHQTGQPGYRDTAPVHVGNQAGSQLQLGGFGDLIEAVWNYVRQGHRLPADAGERLADMGDLLCAIWRHADAGLWELGQQAHYTSSKVGCWSAFQRLLDLADAGHVPGRGAERWRRERDAVREFVEQRLWSERQGSYLMKEHGDALDCATLLAARRGFLAPDDPRLASTIDAIARQLGAGDALLYRYSGMSEKENAFLACSFWMVEAMAIAGRTDQAAEMFQSLLGAGNELGLYSEELQPQSGELRGNFPQALTHLSLIRAAATLREQG